MLYSDLAAPLAPFEYKLIAESMLLELGWNFDLRANIDNEKITDTCKDYVLFEKTSATYDAVLARSAYEALYRSDLTSFETTGRQNLEDTDRITNTDMLKNFLLNCQETLNSKQNNPTPEEVDKLFTDFKKWIMKCYTGESVKSIAASNSKIKFCLLRQFVSHKEFNNYARILENPSLVDIMYADYLGYCRINTSMMTDNDNKLGHEGENNVRLVGTLVFGMDNFISRWAMKSLPKYTAKKTLRDAGDSKFDALDTKYQMSVERYDIDMSTVLGDLRSVNSLVFDNKKNSTEPFYSIISWYQAIYSGRIVSILTRMLSRFRAGKFAMISEVERTEPNTTFEERIADTNFALTNKAIYRGGTKVTGECSVALIPNYTFSRSSDKLETAGTTTNYFWKRFKETVDSLNKLYTKRTAITTVNLWEFCELTCEQDKSNTYFEETAKRSAEGNAEYYNALARFKKRYNIAMMPSNITIHELAMMIYGINAIEDLAHYLEDVGLTVMDLPTEGDMRSEKVIGMSSVSAMLALRGQTESVQSKKYNISDVYALSAINLLTDIDIRRLINAPTLEKEILDEELPTGDAVSMIDFSTGGTEESSAGKIIKHQKALIAVPVTQPIYTPNVTGRAAFITDHSVMSIHSSYMKLIDTTLPKLDLLQTLYTLLLDDNIFNLEKIEATSRMNMIEKCIASTKGKNTAITGQKKDYIIETRALIEQPLKMLRQMMLFSNNSFLSEEGVKDAKEVVIQRVLSRVTSWKDMNYLVGCILFMSKDKPNSKFDAEIKQLLTESGQKMRAMKMMIVEARVKALLTAIELNWETVSNLTTMDYRDALDAPIALNAIIKEIKLVREVMTVLGDSVLREVSNVLLIGTAKTFEVKTGNVYNMRACKLQSLNGYSLLKSKQNGRTIYRQLVAKRFLTKEAVQTTTNGVALDKIYSEPGLNYIAENADWFNVVTGMVGSRLRYRDKVSVVDSSIDKASSVRSSRDTVVQGNSEETAEFISSASLENKAVEVAVFNDSPEEPLRVIDIRVMLSMFIQIVVCSEVFNNLKELAPKTSQTTKKNATTSIVLLGLARKCARRLRDLLGNYSKIIETFREYTMICNLKASESLGTLRYTKNQVAIAAYSDIYQMIIIRSKKEIQELIDFYLTIKKLQSSAKVGAKPAYYTRLKSLGLDYVVPLDNEEQAREIYSVIFEMVNTAVPPHMQENLRRILTAISDMESTLSRLFKLRTAGIKQTRLNASRFSECKEEYLEFIKTREYLMSVYATDKDSPVLKKFKQRFEVDRDTGVFYDSRTQQYFLADSSDSENSDYSKYDMLVNADGRVLVYTPDSQKPFMNFSLEQIEEHIINSLLR